MGDLVESSRVAFLFFVFFSKERYFFLFLAVPLSYFLRVPRRHRRRSFGRAVHGGAGINGRRTDGMSDAIIPSLP